MVELSIVLVILGLLTGGILTGQNLIRAAELRAVTTEFSAYQTAVMAFRDKYFALPGDMANATKFWGSMTNCGVASPSGTGTQTCNGNGDGDINFASAAARTGESFGFWRQLANAGLLEGSYTGIAGAANVSHGVGGTNIPNSKLSLAAWMVFAQRNYLGNASTYAMDYGNTFMFGRPTGGGFNDDPALKPEEAWNIDSKIDDGKPASGKVIAYRWDSRCSGADDGTDANNDLAASYELANTTVICALFFRNAF